MINLYQILHLSPLASEAEIRFALKSMEDNLDERTRKAVHQWLLDANVRARYDAKLRETEPEFFAQFASTSTPSPAEIATTTLIQDKPKIIPKNDETTNDDDYVDLAPLWNPKVAMIWSILLNVVFGAILHAKNWEVLGEKKLAQQNYYFALFACIAMSLLALTDVAVGSLGVNIGLTIAWYHIMGKKQVLFFAENFNDDYEKRGWLLPIVLCLVGIFVWAFVITLLASILGIE